MTLCTSKNPFASPCTVSAAIVAASLLALAGAFTAQYGFGLKPCPLCLAQRAPYAVTALLGMASLILAKKQNAKGTAFVIFLSALTFLVGAGIAFYHNGVEQHWWSSFLEGCKINFNTSGGDMLKNIESTPAARCDVIPWADPILHLSMAAWNIFVSGALAVASLVSSILIVRKANGF